MNLTGILSLLRGDIQAERVVQKRGTIAQLTVVTAGIMAFLAVFAVALSFSAQRLAKDWAADLARTSTLRIPASETMDPAAQLGAALAVLDGAPGVASARALEPADQQALLEPWFGPDVPVSILSLPQLVEIVPDETGFNAATLSEELAAAVPGAVLDDHSQWRQPLVTAANRLRMLGWAAVALIVTAVVAMVTLAVHASLAAHSQVISVLRLVGATDAYIAHAFIRRFTLRALVGATGGTLLGFAATLLVPPSGPASPLPNMLGFPGGSAVWLVAIPLTCAVAAFWATRHAALRTVKETT